MYARLDPFPHESLYDALARWSGAAPTHLLRVLLWAGSLGAIGAMAIDTRQWYVAMGLLALASLGAWGLLEHRLAGNSSRSIQALEMAAAVVTVVSALIAVVVAMFVFMGPAPHF